MDKMIVGNYAKVVKLNPKDFIGGATSVTYKKAITKLNRIGKVTKIALGWYTLDFEDGYEDTFFLKEISQTITCSQGRKLSA